MTMDRYKPEYRQLSQSEKSDVQLVKRIASDLAALLADAMPNGREQSLALTKLDECVMWATKGITE